MPQEIVNFIWCMAPVLMTILGVLYLFLTHVTGAFWLNQNWKFFARVSVWFFIAVVGGLATVFLNLTQEFYTQLLVWGAIVVNTVLSLGMACLMYREYTRPLRR